MARDSSTWNVSTVARKEATRTSSARARAPSRRGSTSTETGSVSSLDSPSRVTTSVAV